MCALRSNSMVFTESRMMLKSVKSNTNVPVDTTKRDIILRTKKLSLDSDSFMKSLQSKYDQKEEPKPPPPVGVKWRHRGAKSTLGAVRETSSLDESSSTDVVDYGEQETLRRKKSLGIGILESCLQKIGEDETVDGKCDEEMNLDTEDDDGHIIDGEMKVMEVRLQEVNVDVQRILSSLSDDDLDLNTKVKEADGAEDNLHEATDNGNIAAIKRLLLEGNCDVNVVNADGMTPLQLACDAKQTLAVRILANNGGDVDIQDRQGRCLLHTAVMGGPCELVAALLRHGAKGDTRDSRRGRTPLHVAAMENELTMIRLLVQHMLDDPWGSQPLLAITDKDRRTPLHLAASRGAVEAAKLLLDAGFGVTCKDLNGHTPMHAALQLNHATKRCRLMLRLLLEAGGDLSLKEECPMDGQDDQQGRYRRGEDVDFAATPLACRNTCDSADENNVGESRRSSKSGGWVAEDLETVERMIHMAARVGCGGCLALLIQYGAPVDSRDSGGRTPLHLAAETSRPSSARTLVRLGALLDARDRRGRTPLHAAIDADSAPLVAALLALGADVDTPDSVGRSYAETALFGRKLSAFTCLVKAGVTGVSSAAGGSILHCSASLGCLTSCQLLLDMGWDINGSDSGGLTPLHATISQGHDHVATLLITEGASIAQRDNKGATPLHYSVRWGGSDALLRLLVKKGAALTAKDRLGRTPLHYAASKQSIMSDLYILLGGGADLNPADISGLTPLHLAARLGNESLVRILLDRGANPTLKDMYHFTPYDHACENHHYSIMHRIKQHIEAQGGTCLGVNAAKETASDNTNNISSVSRKVDITSNYVINGSNANPRRREAAENSAEEDKTGEVTQRIKQEAFKSRSHRTSVAW